MLTGNRYGYIKYGTILPVLMQSESNILRVFEGAQYFPAVTSPWRTGIFDILASDIELECSKVSLP
jgi:hypothetical protein